MTEPDYIAKLNSLLLEVSVCEGLYARAANLEQRRMRAIRKVHRQDADLVRPADTDLCYARSEMSRLRAKLGVMAAEAARLEELRQIKLAEEDEAA